MGIVGTAMVADGDTPPLTNYRRFGKA